jgi:NAD(P)-dependent dehydrogenase (short-subunit alcohol dehydrogenase family)
MERIVVVTGASRGLGRGIARAFGSKGATVFVTGRNAAELDGVVSEIASRGGKGIAVLCDHSDDQQVQALFERVASDAGHLDILVNNAAAVYPEALMAPGGYWEKPLKLADMLDVGLRSNYVAAYYATPMMVAARCGLIASISFYGSVSYFHGPAYGAAKAGTDKMMQDMAVDLAPHSVSTVSIWPGFILTDAVKAMPIEMLPEELRAALPLWETPEFTGLVINALFDDPELEALSGQALIGAELAQRYGIVDSDGKQPISYRDGMGQPARKFQPAQS